MAIKIEGGPQSKIVSQEAGRNGFVTVSIHAEEAPASPRTPFEGDANIFAAESPEAVKELERKAKENGRTVEEERLALYLEVLEW